MTEEIWRQIPETNGVYEVSNFGKVRNSLTGTIRVPKKMPNGYLRVHYNYSCKRYDRYIHRLVAEAFCEHPDGCNVVNHKDMNKENNNAENLEWCTALHNVHHAMANGRAHLFAIPVIGFKNGKAQKYISAHQASVMTGCDSSSITKCCKGKHKSSHGYQWKYAEVV